MTHSHPEPGTPDTADGSHPGPAAPDAREGSHPGPTAHTARDSDLRSLSFEELLARLEEITRRISSGETGIEQATDLYEEAGRVHAAAAARLDQVRQRIEAIQSTGSGRPD
ncbi:MAG: exodeoxyribonuclease VII small subunit [Acidimicrobiales bacterium]